MKKSLLFLIAFIISLSLIGQNEANSFLIHKLRKEKNTFEKHAYFTNTKAEKMLLRGPKTKFDKSAALKSNQIDKQKLDSIIYKKFNSINSQMELSEKDIYNYNVNGNNTMGIYHDWNNTTNQWVGSSRYENAYDVNGNNTMGIYYDWDNTTNQWVASSKVENTFDINGKSTVGIYYDWDNTLNQWIASIKYENTYDGNGRNIMEIYYDWDNSVNQWIEFNKSEYTYDINGNNTLEIYYYWDDDASQWAVYSKYEYTYDGNGNIIREIEYNWSFLTNQLVEAYKYEYTYDGNGNSIMEIDYNWDDGTNQWVESNKYEYTYDGNENNTMEIDYNWDNSTNQWVESYKYEYTHNNSYSFGDLILPYYFGGDIGFFQHMVTAAYSYQWNVITSNWDDDEIIDLYYSTQTISRVNSQSSKIDIEIYPNPATDYIVFDLQNKSGSFLVEFFDVTGRNILRKEVSANNVVDISSLRKGIYIYKLSIDGEIKSGKIAVK